jgi:hypothetical protein
MVTHKFKQLYAYIFCLDENDMKGICYYYYSLIHGRQACVFQYCKREIYYIIIYNILYSIVVGK